MGGLGVDYELTSNYYFLERNGLKNLSIWLWDGIYTILNDSLNKDLISIHTDFYFIKENILDEINELYLRIPDEKSNNIFNHLCDFIKIRIDALNSKKFEHEIAFPEIEYNPDNDTIIKNDGNEDWFIDALESSDCSVLGKLNRAIVDRESNSTIKTICDEIDNLLDARKGEAYKCFAHYYYHFSYTLVEYHVEYLSILYDDIVKFYLLERKPRKVFETKPEYTHLVQLFENEDSFEKYKAMLEKVDPPVINSQNKFILGNRKKSALTAFFKALFKENKIPTFDPPILSKLAKDYFELDTLSREVFYQDKTKVYDHYFDQFVRLLNK